jgi:hypothetical protein
MLLLSFPTPQRYKDKLITLPLIYAYVEKREEKEMTRSLTICGKLHKNAQVLTHKIHLPPIKELEKKISMEKLLEKIEQHIKQR